MKKIYYLLFIVVTFSCAKKEVVPIKLNRDGCDFCKMKIADGKFGAELITEKGRVFKFDDMHCMINYHKENATSKVKNFYINDYSQDNVLIPVETAFYVKGGTINSPMRGNIIAVKTNDEAKVMAAKYNATPISWNEISK